MATKPPVSAPRRRVAPGVFGDFEVDDVVASEMAFGGAPYRSDRAMSVGPKTFSPVEKFQTEKERMEEASRNRQMAMDARRGRGAFPAVAIDLEGVSAVPGMERMLSREEPEKAAEPKKTAVDTGLLARGAKGGRVKQAQRLLQSLNYGVPGEGGKLSELVADGDFGQNTEAAVKAFQRDAGLTPDGIIGEDTIGKMLEAFNESVQKQYRDQNPATEQPRILGPMEEYDKVFKRPVVQAEEEIDETVQQA